MHGLSVDQDGQALVFSLRGEIDFLTAAPVTETIQQAVARARPTRVCVDLSDVTFLDSSGIGVLVAAMRAAKEISASFQVDHPDAYVFDQLDGAGLVEPFGLDGYQVDDPVDRPPAPGGGT